MDDMGVFVTSADLNVTVTWSTDLALPPKILSSDLSQPKGLFVSSTGEIYVDNGLIHARIETWTSNLAPSCQKLQY